MALVAPEPPRKFDGGLMASAPALGLFTDTALPTGSRPGGMGMLPEPPVAAA